MLCKDFIIKKTYKAPYKGYNRYHTSGSSEFILAPEAGNMRRLIYSLAMVWHNTRHDVNHSALFSWWIWNQSATCVTSPLIHIWGVTHCPPKAVSRKLYREEPHVSESGHTPGLLPGSQAITLNSSMKGFCMGGLECVDCKRNRGARRAVNEKSVNCWKMWALPSLAPSLPTPSSPAKT